MKLKIYKRDTMSPSVKNPLPTVSFGQKGIVYLNPAAGNAMEVETKKYSVVQDESKPMDWYFMEDNETGIQFRKTFEYPVDKQIVKGFQFNSVTLCKDVYDSCKFAKPTTRMRLASEPTVIDGVNFFAILTKAVL